MATEHPSYPSKLFGTTGRAFRVLENEGIDTMAFLQRLIDDPTFRTRIAEWFNASANFAPRAYSLKAIKNLEDLLFGNGVYPHPEVGVLPLEVQRKWDELDLVEKFSFLTDGLSDRDVDIYCQRRVAMYVPEDMGGKKRSSLAEVAHQYSINQRQVQSIVESVKLYIVDRARGLRSGKISV